VNGPAQPRKTPPLWLLVLLPCYALLAHALDTLALHGQVAGVDWSVLRWRLGWHFDLFKTVVWLVIPAAMVAPWLDWRYFTTGRWKRRDIALLAGLVVLGALAVLVVRFVPALDALYPSMRNASPAFRADFAIRRLVWTASWLFGWEFLHRYALVAPYEGRGRWWIPLLVVPPLETVYHLAQKPSAWLEAAGMAVFSLALTGYALRRRNTLLPFLAHLAVELELLLFQLYA
jgi:hypothetical protein